LAFDKSNAPYKYGDTNKGDLALTGSPSPCYGSNISIEICSDVFLPICFWWKESLVN